MLIYRTIFQLILNAQSLKDRMKPEVFFKKELVGEGVAGMIGELIVTALMKRVFRVLLLTPVYEMLLKYVI